VEKRNKRTAGKKTPERNKTGRWAGRRGWRNHQKRSDRRAMTDIDTRKPNRLTGGGGREE